MNIKGYNKFIKESGDQGVFFETANGKGFYTKKYGAVSISSLNDEISNYIKSVYGRFGFIKGKNEDLDVMGKIINSEYITKMINNYTIFGQFIKEKNITNEAEFYKLIKENFNDIYHYEGEFFARKTMSILINTTRKGNIGEKKSLAKFEEVAKKKGVNIEILRPTIMEDIKGIDGKFIIDGKTFTIQVKPFISSELRENGLVYVKSNGSLSLGVDYLVLYRNDDFIILKNTKTNPILIENDNFVYNLSNLLFTSV